MKRLILLAALLTCFLASSASAQPRERVILSFNLTNGNLPNAGLLSDSLGNLYGTTSFNGGKYGFGNVFELTPTGNGTWTETVLHDFTGGVDGAWPFSTLISDGSGNLYGTASGGGQGQCFNSGQGCGLVFKLSRNASGWAETVLYDFVPGQTKGVVPTAGLVFDKAGNLYGTTWAPGVLVDRHRSRVGSHNTFWGCNNPGCGGTVYELSPTNNGWKETDLYAFTGANDGAASQASVIFDRAGNLYGTTAYGGTTGCTNGYGCGVVFKLTPANGGWKERVLHQFTGATDGAYPVGNLIERAGVLYSTTSSGGAFRNGTVFSLSPQAHGLWAETVLHSFSGGADGGAPLATVVADDEGNLYGTTNQGGTFWGVVYELKARAAWSETVLHTFGGSGDAENPAAPVIFGRLGHLYGTSQSGGSFQIHGAVFEVSL